MLRLSLLALVLVLPHFVVIVAHLRFLVATGNPNARQTGRVAVLVVTTY